MVSGEADGAHRAASWKGRTLASSELSPARGRGHDQFESDDVTGEQRGEQGERRMNILFILRPSPICHEALNPFLVVWP